MESTPNRPTVFVSYSSLDRALARRVARRLVHCGAQVIIDEVDLRPGLILTEELQQQIRRSTHLLVVWTEASAGSHWVAREIEFARGVPDSPPAIIPFLVVPPGHDSAVSNIIGVEFRRAYRFELAFQDLRKSILPAGAGIPGEEQLRQDLAAAVQEAPFIARVLHNPVADLFTTFKATVSPEVEEADRRPSRPAMEDAMKAWTPEGVSVRGLPTPGDAEYHTLDFALWCASHLVLLQRASPAPLLPAELATYPEIFIKVFGATQAGYEALIALLSSYPCRLREALLTLSDRSTVAQSSIPGIVELFEEVIAIYPKDPAWDQFTPYDALNWFLEANLDRLSSDQKLIFLRLIEAHARGPHPGPPLDVLGALCRDPELTPDVVHRVRIWVEDGRFDRADVLTGSAPPASLYGFLAGMLKAGLREQAKPLFAAVHQRIRKLFRSAEEDKLVAALRWLAAAGRLPLQERHIIDRACSEGVYSVEFEGSPHAELVRRLAQFLVESVTRYEQTGYDITRTIQIKLKEAGFTEEFY